jgi:hypothetical protein
MGRAGAAPGCGGRGLGGGPGGPGAGGGRGQRLRPLPAGAGGPGPGHFPGRGPCPGCGWPGPSLPTNWCACSRKNSPGNWQPLSLVLILGPVSLFYDEQIPLAERRRLFGHMVDTLTAYKARAPLLLLQPPLPRGAVNRHFGRLMTPLLDSLVKMENHQENRIGTPGGEVSMGASPSRFHDRGKRRYPGPGRSQTGGLSRGRIGI